MSRIKIKTISYGDCTMGRLEVDGFQCFTLELPWLNNKNDKSCIPAGVYEYQLRYSPSLGYQVIHLIDVDGREWIYVHAGNFTSQILGCILVGDSLKDINSDGVVDVTNSKATFHKLMNVITATGTVEIQRFG